MRDNVQRLHFLSSELIKKTKVMITKLQCFNIVGTPHESKFNLKKVTLMYHFFENGPKPKSHDKFHDQTINI